MRSQHCSALGSAFTTPTARTRARATGGHTGGHTGEGEGDISQGHGILPPEQPTDYITRKIIEAKITNETTFLKFGILVHGIQQEIKFISISDFRFKCVIMQCVPSRHHPACVVRSGDSSVLRGAQSEFRLYTIDNVQCGDPVVTSNNNTYTQS